jgi:hypothetical protein
MRDVVSGNDVDHCGSRQLGRQHRHGSANHLQAQTWVGMCNDMPHGGGLRRAKFKSGTLWGVGEDAAYLAEHMVALK